MTKMLCRIRLSCGLCGYRYTIPFLLLLMTLIGCARKQVSEDWKSILTPVQEKYAPDPRLAVFRIDVRLESGGPVATGEVEDPAAKKEIIERLEQGLKRPVTDQIRVLPDPTLGPKIQGIINVSVGNVRRGPEHPAELVSQVLLGDTVRLLQKRGGWYFIRCADRYLGWIDEEALVPVDSKAGQEWIGSNLQMVTRLCERLKSEPAADASPVCDLTSANLVRLISEKGSWAEVSLPDGRHGFVDRAAVMDYQRWRASRALTPENIERSARDFMGVPYLWGGTSAKGFDCSGFVKTVFLLNGMPLQRDADQQARQGKEVDPGSNFAALQRGDLLFFGRKAAANKPERIRHVGIYLERGQFIQCSGRVRISSLVPNTADYDEGHVKNFVRARRIITR